MRPFLQLCKTSTACAWRRGSAGPKPFACVNALSNRTAYGLGSRAFGAVPAALVKELRERTGASMGKCREALAAEEGDITKAVEWLRRKGVKSMEKRTAEPGEALLALSVDSTAGAFVELRSETDFVARTELFQQLAMSIAAAAARHAAAGNVDAATALEGASRIEAQGSALRERASEGYESVAAALMDVGSVLGERLALGAVQCVSAPQSGVVAGYVHPKSADGLPGMGRMAALVALQAVPAATCDESSLSKVASQLARHIVAGQPEFVSIESIPADRLQKELDVFKAAHLEQLGPDKAAKVNDKVLEKVLEGKTRKFHQDTVLLCQELIAPGAGDDAASKPKRVSEWLDGEAKALGLEQLVVRDFRLTCL